MFKAITTGIMAAALAFGASAVEAAYQFSLTGFKTDISWELPASPLPDKDSTSEFSADFYDVPVTWNGAESSGLLRFYVLADGFTGAVDVLRDNDVLFTAGPQLFTGSTFAPTFILGQHDLTDWFDPSIAYTLTITDLDAGSAVPEPAAWALMIGGFGIAGTALRRRRRETAAA